MSDFFQWLAGLSPLLQIPVTLLSFAVVIGLVLAFVEVSTNRGRGFAILRLLASVLVPVVILLLLGLYASVMWVAAVAAVLGLAV